MAYSDVQLPEKTIKILDLIKKHDGELTKMSIANYCSYDENWPRVEVLLESGLITEETVRYEEFGEELSYPGLFLSNEGLAFLSDYHAEKSRRKKDRIVTILISAVTSAIVAWGPNILNILLSIFSTFCGAQR